MFTGIVEEVGHVVALTTQDVGARLHVRAPTVASEAWRGDSIAVNGVCLTVTKPVTHDRNIFTADIMTETLRCTTLGSLRIGDAVNLERAVRADGRLGGHIVQGHVDATAALMSRQKFSQFRLMQFSLSAQVARYVIPKASITIDGVSLTVIETTDDWFTVSLIPETLRATTLGVLKVGESVNLEADVLAKHLAAHAERLLPSIIRTGGSGWHD
ncbi:riboflavin synthase [Kribbella sp. NPDC004536]|uniref:riboflavin synthase n=1 Tax=Kribbella sp. NPDC004536 TaxID=3364106 RepID=UPI003698CA22